MFKDLVEENNDLRDEIEEKLMKNLTTTERNKGWLVINELIENEIKQETECGR